MIQVSYRRDLKGCIRHISCRGHAGFDPEGGVDIVCAGVSALMGAMAVGLTEVVKAPVKVSEGDGRMVIDIPGDLTEEQSKAAQVLAETIIKALEQLARNYAGFIKLNKGRPI